ncbi:MAG: hypothetical protein Q9213_005018 [Squamulea squamosa]
MEKSPLIIAHAHARNAAIAPNPAAAEAEHEQAASQFAAAAKGTSNLEASRALKLLEQHHKKLADLLKFRTAHPIPPSTPAIDEKLLPSHAIPPASQQPGEGSPHRSQPQTVLLPQRDISSSIASNLASARGIPSNRQRRSQQSPLQAQTVKPEAPNPQRRSKLIEETYQNRRSQLQRTSSSNNTSSVRPPSTSTSQEPSPTPDPTPTKSDEPFQRFYSTFESLFSKLSAPLAFAGLPLNLDADPPTPIPSSSAPTSPKPSSSQIDRPLTIPSKPSSSSSRRALEASQRVSAEPDYKNLFSRAALRAVADEHGPGSVGANESFYVVPTSGHTLAYADILARQHHERRRNQGHQTRTSGDNSDDGEFEGDEELFVDARETPGPPSPEVNRRRKGKAVNIGTKTMEELQLENEAMKALLDQTSRRLLEFEMSAQTSSVALARSIRQLNMQNMETSATGAGGGGSKEAEEKMRALEEQILARVKEMAKVERENEKLKGVVGRYRERFETIKAGARARRDERGKSGEEGI